MTEQYTLEKLCEIKLSEFMVSSEGEEDDHGGDDDDDYDYNTVITRNRQIPSQRMRTSFGRTIVVRMMNCMERTGRAHRQIPSQMMRTSIGRTSVVKMMTCMERTGRVHHHSPC